MPFDFFVYVRHTHNVLFHVNATDRIHRTCRYAQRTLVKPGVTSGEIRDLLLS